MPVPEHPVPEQGAQLSPELRAALLDPALWREALEKYALTTNLTVALVDAEGRLLGECINPRPTWDLFRAGNPTTGGGCPFALAPVRPCACWADALDEGGVVHRRDRTGLVHFAVPLTLGGQALGALLAGQVFDQYPEQPSLDHAATKFDLPPQKVWKLARLEQPVKRATLEVYAGLLTTLGQTFLQTHYHTRMEADRLAEMTRLRDQLAEADHRKDEFLAMLAHELRNPLAPIRSAAQVLRLLGEGDPNIQWSREVVERQVQHMTRLVDDLLDISRISRGKIQLQKVPLDLAAVVARAVETSRPSLEGRRHKLIVELPPEPVWVEGDFTRLAQVLANLLDNAAKYTEEGGRVWLTAEQASGGCEPPGEVLRVGCEPPDEVLIRVRDTGIGIAAEMLPRVFDLFTQADQSLDRSQGGLGIGLTMVRRLVELHGGGVEATSAGLKQGSEFVVRLPLLPESRRPRSAAKEDNGQGVPPPARRVLVVDDNVDGANSLARLLGLSGHDTRIAHDGPAALAAARDFQPEVVLLDIGLPQMDGYEVARRLRHEAGGAVAMLVALTGYGQEDDRHRSREAGFDHHLVKPVELDALETLLRQPRPSGNGPVV